MQRPAADLIQTCNKTRAPCELLTENSRKKKCNVKNITQKFFREQPSK
jgi:hypothetical protein